MLYDHPDLYDAFFPVGEAELTHYRTLARLRAGATLALACRARRGIDAPA